MDLRAPVQCSDDTGNSSEGLATIQTGRECVPQDLESDAERVEQSAGAQRGQAKSGKPAAGAGVPQQSPDRIEITGAKSKIIATGLAGALKPGTIFQLGSENHMTVHHGAHRSGSDREGRQANIKNAFPLTKSQEVPAPRHFDLISVGLAGDWRRLGRALDITDSQLDQIRMDYQYEGQHEVNYRVLLRWKQQYHQPTLARLAQILLNIGRGDLADELARA